MRLSLGAIALTILVHLLSACTGQPATLPVTIRIALGDFYFHPTSIRLTTGERVRLEMVNEGTVQHEFRVGRGLEQLTWANEPLKQDFFKGIQVVHTEKNGTVKAEVDQGTYVILEPGGSAALVFTVPADKKGEWEMGCLIPGHYESGMNGALTVE